MMRSEGIGSLMFSDLYSSWPRSISEEKRSKEVKFLPGGFSWRASIQHVASTYVIHISSGTQHSRLRKNSATARKFQILCEAALV